MSVPCRPATSSSTPRQTIGAIASTPSAEKRPPPWASSAETPPCSLPSIRDVGQGVDVGPDVAAGDDHLVRRRAAVLADRVAVTPHEGHLEAGVVRGGRRLGRERLRQIQDLGPRRQGVEQPAHDAPLARDGLPAASVERARLDDGLVHEPAVLQDESAGALAGGSSRRARRSSRLGHLLLRGGEDLVDDGELRRVDRGASQEPQVLALSRGPPQAVEVPDVRVDALDGSRQGRPPARRPPPASGRTGAPPRRRPRGRPRGRPRRGSRPPRARGSGRSRRPARGPRADSIRHCIPASHARPIERLGHAPHLLRIPDLGKPNRRRDWAQRPPEGPRRTARMPGALTRTKTGLGGADSRRRPAFCLASSLRVGATASSRSRTTASASEARAFSTRRGSLAGT